MSAHHKAKYMIITVNDWISAILRVCSAPAGNADLSREFESRHSVNKSAPSNQKTIRLEAPEEQTEDAPDRQRLRREGEEPAAVPEEIEGNDNEAQDQEGNGPVRDTCRR